MKKRLSRSPILITLVGLLCLLVIGLNTVEYLRGEPFDQGDVMTLVMLFVLALHLFTWGTDFKMANDEMGKQITHHSATISYHISVLGLFVFWIVDRIVFLRKGDFGNISLFAALCFVLVLHPLVQFFVARRYR
ncbi:hypothetical protein [Laceyella sacchari]|jgi:hypothetical protein|uniref:Uncharacterized protein n=1 Tax=Laceyella sacchari TaxID=37482 RepID=A0ABY5U3J0_LACSH|nr:hypothetical protein [Laceyella sacchari]KPC69310.1 hypothetical protein ADL26_18580 [Thermoactinomyces vulgaris]UWE04179.1 hypothetical protein NYR52_03175 [Laceyella sacchari]